MFENIVTEQMKTTKICFILLFSHFDAEAGPNHKMRGDHKGAEQKYNKCFGLSPEFHGKDHPCVFPFIYRGIVSDPELDLSLLKFIYSEKATKFCKIFTLLLTGTKIRI